MVGVGRGATSRPCWTARIAFPCRDGLLLTKVGFVFDMFVLDVFRRFVLGMFFFLAGLSACHWLLLRTRVVAVCQDNVSAWSKGSPLLRTAMVSVRADGTGSSPTIGYRMRQGCRSEPKGSRCYCDDRLP